MCVLVFSHLFTELFIHQIWKINISVLNFPTSSCCQVPPKRFTASRKFWVLQNPHSQLLKTTSWKRHFNRNWTRSWKPVWFENNTRYIRDYFMFILWMLCFVIIILGFVKFIKIWIWCFLLWSIKMQSILCNRAVVFNITRATQTQKLRMNLRVKPELGTLKVSMYNSLFS